MSRVDAVDEVDEVAAFLQWRPLFLVLASDLCRFPCFDLPLLHSLFLVPYSYLNATYSKLLIQKGGRRKRVGVCDVQGDGREGKEERKRWEGRETI